MKKVYIHGSFMNDNFGDYLLCAKIVETVREKHKDVKIYSANVAEFYDDFISIDSYDLKTAIQQADLAILAGGGYFGEPNKHKLYWNIRMIIKHAGPILRLIKRKVPICIVGVGVGPLSLSFSRKIVAKIFEKAEVVAVRDIESKQYLCEYGVKRKISVYPDWIMSCRKEELLKNGCLADSYKDKILIHLASKNKGNNSPLDIVLADIERLINEKKYSFLIITDQKDNGQIERAKAIYSRFSKYGVQLYEYNNPYELCSIINSSKAVITDKLHVGIVATRLGIPAFSVAYHNKTERFYKQVGREQYSIPIENVTAGTLYNWIEGGISENINVAEVINKAKGNEELVNTFLDKYL